MVEKEIRPLLILAVVLFAVRSSLAAGGWRNELSDYPTTLCLAKHCGRGTARAPSVSPKQIHLRWRGELLEFVALGGKFPRLTKKTAEARVKGLRALEHEKEWRVVTMRRGCD